MKNSIGKQIAAEMEWMANELGIGLPGLPVTDIAAIEDDDFPDWMDDEIGLGDLQ